MSGGGRLRHATSVIATAAMASGAARAAYGSLGGRPPGGAGRWTRTNHRGEPVTLLEGPAVAFGAVSAAAFGPGLPARVRAALIVAGAGAAAFGGYDDLAGSGDRRGFRGHLGSLARGEVTTGAVKIGGIGATGVLAAAALGGSPVDGVINTGLVAGGANLLNLFDLRPGRALKVALAGGALLAPGGGPSAGRTRGARVVAAPLGAGAALLGEDLGERAMLGDAGANALGAMLGVAAAAALSRPARVALLAGIIGLTAASEVVSFTAVIERTPALRKLDMLGRRPPAPQAARAGAGASAAPAPGNGAEPASDSDAVPAPGGGAAAGGGGPRAGGGQPTAAHGARPERS
jgi:UDP-GlcNAc:undecaprenyl-phosphate/decaprenyl-phosphate GlcNAc-1-phosphate transferase